MVAIEIHLENAGALHWFAVDFALGLGTAFEEDPGGLDGVGVTHAQRCLTGMISGEPQHDVADAAAELFDRFIARHRTAPDLVQEPPWSANGNLPVGNALQVAADVGLAQLWLGNEWHGRWKLGVDDLGSFPGAIQWAVHDPPNAGVAQRSADGGGLRPTQRAEVEAGQMTVEDPVRVLDIGMAHQEHARARFRKAQPIESTIGAA